MSKIKNKQEMEACKKAGMEIFNQLESKGVTMVGCSVFWDDDNKEFVVSMSVHLSEEGKNHVFPTENKKFKIVYEYMDYPEFA